jgi:hypothetical protein
VGAFYIAWLGDYALIQLFAVATLRLLAKLWNAAFDVAGDSQDAVETCLKDCLGYPSLKGA